VSSSGKVLISVKRGTREKMVVAQEKYHNSSWLGILVSLMNCKSEITMAKAYVLAKEGTKGY
jgi:hypothetical protein